MMLVVLNMCGVIIQKSLTNLEIKRLTETLDSISLSSDLPKSLIAVYTILAKEGFVGKDEITTVTAWIKEIERYL